VSGSPARRQGVLCAGTAALAGLGLLMALTETRFPTIVGAADPAGNLLRFTAGLLLLSFALRMAPGINLPFRHMGPVICLAFAGCLVAGVVGGVAWPNSGDEYSYVFLADLLLHGRVAAVPPPDLVLFANFHVLVHDGWMFSPYPPGWSMLLAPFRAAGAEVLVNPLLTVLLGAALAATLARLGIVPAVRRAAVALVLLAPFTLFMGGSMFPQTLAATAVAGIVWLQVGDEAAPGRLRKLAIGVLFGVLLITRYDVLAMVALLYALDRLMIRRLAALGDGAWVAFGSLPFVALHLGYNLALTGDTLMLPAVWGGMEPLSAPDMTFGMRMVLALTQNLQFAGELALFGGLPVAALALLGLVARVRARTCRFWNFLLPSAIVFYSLIPFTGGHQYGPRYWFWAFPVCVVTVVTALVDTSGLLRVGSRRVAFERFAACCLLCGSVAFAGLLMTTRTYMQARQEVYAAAPPMQPATVMVPDRLLVLWPWQAAPIMAHSLDFTRNDPPFTGPILYARDNVEDSISRACRLPDRHVYRWVAPGELQQVGCP